MCEFRGHLSLSNPILPELEPEGIPAECEVIVYSRFSIDKFSMIDVDVGKYFITCSVKLSCSTEKSIQIDFSKLFVKYVRYTKYTY